MDEKKVDGLVLSKKQVLYLYNLANKEAYPCTISVFHRWKKGCEGNKVIENLTITNYICSSFPLNFSKSSTKNKLRGIKLVAELENKTSESQL